MPVSGHNTHIPVYVADFHIGVGPTILGSDRRKANAVARYQKTGHRKYPLSRFLIYNFANKLAQSSSLIDGTMSSSAADCIAHFPRQPIDKAGAGFRKTSFPMVRGKC
jgi:hypothetical protein